MLKITVVENGKEQRLIVEGKLAEPCVSELESAWSHVRLASGNRPILVDLSGVTLINSRGEAALSAMIAEGARLTAKGLYSEFVVKQLMNKSRKARIRPRRRKRDGEKDSSLTGKRSVVSQCPPNKETQRDEI
jgi:hypothetical protein